MRFDMFEQGKKLAQYLEPGLNNEGLFNSFSLAPTEAASRGFCGWMIIFTINYNWLSNNIHVKQCIDKVHEWVLQRSLSLN